MKASDLEKKKRPPPHVFTLGLGAWADTAGRARPAGPVEIGLRRPAADDYLRAHLAAVDKADESHKGPSDGGPM